MGGRHIPAIQLCGGHVDTLVQTHYDQQPPPPSVMLLEENGIQGDAQKVRKEDHDGTLQTFLLFHSNSWTSMHFSSRRRQNRYLSLMQCKAKFDLCI